MAHLLLLGVIGGFSVQVILISAKARIYRGIYPRVRYGKGVGSAGLKVDATFKVEVSGVVYE